MLLMVENNLNISCGVACLILPELMRLAMPLVPTCTRILDTRLTSTTPEPYSIRHPYQGFPWIHFDRGPWYPGVLPQQIRQDQSPPASWNIEQSTRLTDLPSGFHSSFSSLPGISLAGKIPESADSPVTLCLDQFPRDLCFKGPGCHGPLQTVGTEQAWIQPKPRHIGLDESLQHIRYWKNPVINSHPKGRIIIPGWRQSDHVHIGF